MQALSSLIETTETRRLEASRKLKPATQTQLGQFMTPQPIAQFMAELFDQSTLSELRLLDPGAGIGSLTAAFVEATLQRPNKPQSITVAAYEVDSLLSSYLQQTLTACQQSCNKKAIDFEAQIYQEDFILAGADLFFLSSIPSQTFTHAILNPPYKKIQTKSAHRSILSSLGIETVNLYSAFLAITIKLLEPGGQFVAIIPRSFCNGTYYKPFRRFLLNEVGIKHIHLFESRDGLFDDGVLQENIILHGIKHQPQQHTTISSSTDASFRDLQARSLSFSQVVKPNDPEAFIYLSHHQENHEYAEQIAALPCTLKDLGIKVSTGPVVDFRLAQYLEPDPKPKTYPLIYPQHCQNYFVHWPILGAKKPNAIADQEAVRKWLYPNGYYVVVKRFSSKEEPRRISAYIHDPQHVPGERIGFENHLNIFHIRQNGLPPELARGLALYLNSSLCDLYFRQFNGHTQVNVGDLYKLRFPNAETLIRLGSHLNQTHLPEQSQIDALVEEELFIMTNQLHPDAHAREQKLIEARQILEGLGFLRLQFNNRSALILLALLNLQAHTAWSQAENPILRTKEIIDWCREHYGVHYAPNTRETIRKDTLHYFADATLIVQNPDEPNRPINSPKWCYQVEPEALELIRSFGTPEWESKLAAYQQQREGLKQRYSKIRQDQQVQVLLEQGETYQLSPGEHSTLIKAIITEFRQKFAPNSKVIYIGDTCEKWAHFDQTAFQALGIQLDPHGKMPDVVIYDHDRQWLILVESVTSSGTVDGKRHAELARLFSNAQAGLVYVTAFPDRQLMRRYLDAISWESEVWIAEAPDHLIHFNGERFLGPYDTKQ